jgi:hypothetical protein
MNWKLVCKDKTKQPKTGTYSDWKELIAEECFYQCVYCSIHEAQFGGIDHYHIDHFRPKSREEFKELENSILNLFYACPICNRFKSNDWPGEPNEEQPCYLDPSEVNYSDLFSVEGTFLLKGKNVAARYIIERLFLNRAQLVMERREINYRAQTSKLIDEIGALIAQLDEGDKEFIIFTLKRIDSIKNKLLGLDDYRRRIRPYKLDQIRKK